MDKTTKINKVKDGILLYCRNVMTTLGPKGKTAIIKKEDGSILITKDGLTVGSYVTSDDYYESIGIDMAKTACKEANNLSGDGSTTTACHIYHLLEHPLHNLDDDIRAIQESAKKPTSEDLYLVAVTSSNGDAELASNIEYIYNEIGTLDYVTLTEDGVNSVVINDSVRIMANSCSMRFGDNPNVSHNYSGNGTVVFLKEKVTDLNTLKAIIDKHPSGKVIVLAPKFNANIVSTIILNNEMGRTDLYLMEYIPSPTMEFVINILSPLTSHKVHITADSISIMYDGKHKEDLDGKVNELLKAKKEAISNKESYEATEAILSIINTKSASVSVYGETTMSRKEKYDRYEDALRACTNALKHGVIEGGGKGLEEAFKDNMPPYIKAYIDLLPSSSFKVLDSAYSHIQAIKKADDLVHIINNSEVVL